MQGSPEPSGLLRSVQRLVNNAALGVLMWPSNYNKNSIADWVLYNWQ
ncbi:MAG: hypothetical protein RLZZ316_660 [Bacteroidota bacterium]